MATRPPDISDRIRADHCAVRAAMGTGVSAGYAASTRSYWTQWLQFCAQLNLDPHLANITDPIPFLQIFAHRVRTGELAIHGQRVRKRQVEQYLRAVGQVLSGLGARDPRHDAHGNTDFRISRQLRSYAREDPPPTRVKPLPIAVLHDIFRHHIRGNARDQCIADVIWIGFYFLLRPGEHCDAGASNDSAPFRLCDVTFRRRQRVFDSTIDPLTTLATADHVALTFTTQKNGVKGEAIGTRRSGHRTGCAVRRLLSRVAYLRCRRTSYHTPIASYHDGAAWQTLKSADLTKAICDSVRRLGRTVGLTPAEVSTRSLRASGAMAMLLGGIDGDVIRIIGRWKSDTMLRYLHVSAQSLTHNHARSMLRGGDYDLLAPAQNT